MPDLYDRATCATELRLRDDILERIRTAWQPVGPFEVPNINAGAGQGAESPDVSSTSAETAEAEGPPEVGVSDLYGVLDTDGSRGFF